VTQAVWFVLAALALVAGAALLVLDSRRRTARSRARREWATARGLRFTAADPVITAQYTFGVFTRGGAGRALDLATGPQAGTTVHVFDLEQRGTVTATVVALQRPAASATVLELRLNSSDAPQEAGTDLLGPVGTRFAFTTDLESARRAVDQRMVTLADATGADVPVLWGEGAWALAAVSPWAGAQRWDEVLAVLGRYADLLRVLPPVEPGGSHRV
jgi:hypothetical protein